jgi:hypothetical protein
MQITETERKEIGAIDASLSELAARLRKIHQTGEPEAVVTKRPLRKVDSLLYEAHGCLLEYLDSIGK